MSTIPELKSIRLTQTVKKGGCAAKLPAGELRKFLSELPLNHPEELIVGTENLDDAALWNLGNGNYLVQTLDFFTPVIDDAMDFGRIAACNALSDVYAMGGQPKTAMTILSFPTEHLPMEMIRPLMTGAIEKIHEAGACLVGGHSIDDETLKLGFSVTGFVSSDRAWTNKNAQVDDLLILTKPLGTGTITSALKGNEANSSWVKAAVKSMTTLNRVPELLKDFGPKTVSGATDITGFGLLGHAVQMAQASKVAFEIFPNLVPSIQGARESIKQDNLNRAHQTNMKYVAQWMDLDLLTVKFGIETKWLLLDAQTSGGLLLSVRPDEAERVLSKLRSQFSESAVIGRVVAQKDQSQITWAEFKN